MNAVQFIRIGSWFVQNCQIPFNQERLETVLTGQFWSDCKIRNQRWASLLSDLEARIQQNPGSNVAWLNYAGAAHEIILAEFLSRIWFAIADFQSNSDDVRYIAQYIIKENCQLRQQVIQRFENVPEAVQPLADRTDELFALVGRMNDLMLSQLPDTQVARTFAFSKLAFDGFVDCARGFSNDVLKKANVALTRASIEDVKKIVDDRSFSEDLNQKIVDAMMSVVSEQAQVSSDVAVCA